jgi:lysozyme family protein
MTPFERAALDFVLGPDVEGNGSAGPSDPGGETKWSIARARHPEIDDAAWASWTRADSEALLLSGYWAKNRCGEMPWRWALPVFDAAVNQGAASILALAQRALGLRADGVLGPATLAAMGSSTDAHTAVFLRFRTIRYIADSEFAEYKDGWLDRLFLVAQAAGRTPA